jgi:hypothetical protein
MHRHWFGERQRHRTTDVDEFVPFQRFVVVVRSNLNITMRSIWQKMLTERGYLHRGVVLLLLLLIFADLAGPQRCCGELTLPSSFSATIPISDGGEMSVFSATPADQQRPQPETPESERGCFCSCIAAFTSPTSLRSGGRRSRYLLSQSRHLLRKICFTLLGWLNHYFASNSHWAVRH